VVTETVLQFTGLSKTFGATRALIDVDFDVRAGEVHGLVGRNGSGKSTLIKVLSGYHVPDPGSRLTLDGQEIHLPISGREAAAHGLVFVHQDLGLVPAYSVLENIRLNSWQAHGLQKINWKAERAGVEDELERFGIQVNAETPVAALSQVDRAIVAIVRAMHHLGSDGRDGKGKVLVLDEPTAYLPTDSVERLFEAVRTVAATGAGVVFVSHRTDEVLSITDRITVLRDGRLIDTVTTADTDEQALVSLILGRALSSFYPDPVQAAPGERILEITDLNGDLVRDFNLTTDRGEIVGITGLMGAGHDEVPYYIFGARDAKSGNITVNGQALKTHKATPTEAIAAGVALLPADRLNLSGSAAASVEDNVALPVFRQYFSRGRLQLAQVRERVGGLLTTFDVRPAMPNLEFSALSGGNQQKALLAKWLQMEPTLLLLHEPTQGVDVGSKADIFSRITEAAEAGTSVIIASAEHEDLANLCTRVIVFDSGRVVGELSGAELSEERILELCYRGARGRGAHGMVFQWRPYRVGFVGEGTEPEFLEESVPSQTVRVFRWHPHRVGFEDIAVIPAATVIAEVAVAPRVFRWHPHRVGYVDAA
jgi:ribose transport system ATP-binding protein